MESASIEAIQVNAGRLDQSRDHDPLLVTLVPELAAIRAHTDAAWTISPDFPLASDGLEGETLRNILRINWFAGPPRMIRAGTASCLSGCRMHS